MLARSLGPGLVVLFGLSQAFRDVYFADVFQGVSFFAVLLIAFSLSLIVFLATALIRDRAGLVRLGREWRALIGMNVTTALAWSCYFFSLTHLQPSIVNTLHSGVGPLTVLALGSFGIHFAKPSRVKAVEYICYAGLAGSLVFLWWVVLAGHSGLPEQSIGVTLGALALLIVSGSSITISLLLSKRLADRGIGADAITAGRYLLLIVVALIVTLAGGRPSGIASMHQFEVLVAAATLLMVLPLYALQVGIGRTAPLTAHVVRSLGPVFVFALELVDGRVAYAPLALLGVALYSVFSIAANLAHGWSGAAKDITTDQPRAGPAHAAEAALTGRRGG